MNNSDSTTDRFRASRVSPTSPNFVHSEFLLVNVIIDVLGRAREHVVSVLQQTA